MGGHDPTVIVRGVKGGVGGEGRVGVSGKWNEHDPLTSLITIEYRGLGTESAP